LFLSTLKNDALNESIDNLTQLNVKNIVLFDTKFSVASIDDDKIEKLRTRSIQACKQCERADFVNISSMKYRKVIESLKDYDLVLFAYENTTNPFVSDLKEFKGKKIALTGVLTSRTYTDQNGNKRTVYEVVVDRAEFCESKGESKGETKNATTTPNFEELGEDDDLPF
jgi:hypothetical protein